MNKLERASPNYIWIGKRKLNGKKQYKEKHQMKGCLQQN